MSITLPTPIDMMHLPAQFQSDVQTFLTNNLNLNWQTWVKPRGATMCYLLAIAGAGGGGGGRTGNSGTARGGGGGGGSASLSRLILPAFFLSDELYIQVGLGGLGGAANNAGGNGSATTISLGRNSGNGSPSVLITTLPGNGGAAGGTSGASSGGSGGSATVSSNNGALSLLGFFSATAGSIGTNGGNAAGAAGTNSTGNWNTVWTTPGTGGGGCTSSDFAGGNITFTAGIDFNAWPLNGGAAGGGSGDAGIELWQPFYNTGGCGGGSNNGGTGGAGGKGGVGCGGGGGGGGVTGGRGGDGGNGAVIIISW